MQLSKTTLDILKNFASINQNILIKAGSELSTRTVAKNVYTSATVDDVFPVDVGIYNLSELLGIISLFSKPEFTFGESAIEISQDSNRVTYMYSSPEVLDFPDKGIKMPVPDESFDLTEEQLKSLMKAGAVLGSTDLKIWSNDGKITCSVLDPKNPSSNVYSADVGTTENNFECYIKLENLRMPQNSSYVVCISQKRITQFKSKTLNYMMFIGAEKNSVWNDAVE